ncbi:hypothetical protein [Paraburkholderia sp. BR10954]|uniref:hypothetical protein n=1 Tax=Paraburkholderia sp. BR10954 TaxID=3236995 RepID=UPI0034D28CFC
MNEKFRGKTGAQTLYSNSQKKIPSFLCNKLCFHGRSAVVDDDRGVEVSLEKFNATVAGASDMSDKARRLAAELPGIEALYRSVALEINGLAVSSQHDAAIAAIDTRW